MSSYTLLAQNISQFVIVTFSSPLVLEPDFSMTLYSSDNLNPIQASGKFPNMRTITSGHNTENKTNMFALSRIHGYSVSEVKPTWPPR
jgi:hypothetical protein